MHPRWKKIISNPVTKSADICKNAVLPEKSKLLEKPAVLKNSKWVHSYSRTITVEEKDNHILKHLSCPISTDAHNRSTIEKIVVIHCGEKCLLFRHICPYLPKGPILAQLSIFWKNYAKLAQSQICFIYDLSFEPNFTIKFKYLLYITVRQNEVFFLFLKAKNGRICEFWGNLICK